MRKEGLHELAYSLTLDPAEEIRGALVDVAAKNWQELHSLDKLLGDTAEKDTLEAEVKDASVVMTGNEASYRTDTVRLPENYKDSGYKTAADDDEDAEVDYASHADGMVQAQKTFEKEIEEKVHFLMLNLAHIKQYTSAEHRERVENHKISLGYAMQFLLTAIQMATS